MIKTLKVIGKILSFQVDKAKLLNYVGETFGRGVQEHTAKELNKLDPNQDGKINIIDLIIFLLEKVK